MRAGGLQFPPGSSMLNINERQASSLIGLVLTQAALLSFPHDEPEYDPSVSNGILGLCMGGCAALLGCFMLWRGSRLRQQEENK